MEAADYAIARAEAVVDRKIGHDARVRLGRLCGAAVLGAPLAWFIAGRRWDGVAIGGLAAGVALFAVVDVFRSIVRARRIERP